MSKEEDKILSQEIGKIGGPGSRLVAKWLPNNVLELSLKTNETQEKTFQAVSAVLRQEGKIIEKQREDENASMICAVVGSGFWNMNPTHVKI